MADLASLFGYAQSSDHLTSSGTVANSKRCGWPVRCIRTRQSHFLKTRIIHTDACAKCWARKASSYAPTRADGRIGRPAGSFENGPHRHGGRNLGHNGAGRGRSDPRSGRVATRLRISAFTRTALWRILQTTDRRAGRVAGRRRCCLLAPSPAVTASWLIRIKHGLQPYGCGAVIFRDQAVGRVLQTRFALHLLHVWRTALGRD